MMHFKKMIIRHLKYFLSAFLETSQYIWNKISIFQESQFSLSRL